MKKPNSGCFGSIFRLQEIFLCIFDNTSKFCMETY